MVLEHGFRALRADEVEVRIGQVKDSGVSLLLYKDARCDMNVLDETVGPMNWQKSYTRDNANCTVSIWDPEKEQWVSKEDTGTESMTESEKGLASDSFKRACFNWGIGRELYTAPFIWIVGATKKDRFRVSEMDVENHRITRLEIVNVDSKGEAKVVAFKMGEKRNEPDPEAHITEADWRKLEKVIKSMGYAPSSILSFYSKNGKPSSLTYADYGMILNELKLMGGQNEQQGEG